MNQIGMYPVSYKFQLEFHRLWSRAFDTGAHMFLSTYHPSRSSSAGQHINISHYLLHYKNHAIAQAGFQLRRPGFDPKSVHVGFVVDKVAMGQVFSEYFGFSCQFSFH
jgi:hypothetical protein